MHKYASPHDILWCNNIWLHPGMWWTCAPQIDHMHIHSDAAAQCFWFVLYRMNLHNKVQLLTFQLQLATFIFFMLQLVMMVSNNAHVGMRIVFRTLFRIEIMTRKCIFAQIASGWILSMVLYWAMWSALKFCFKIIIIRNKSIHSMCRLPAALISSYALQVADSREDRQMRTCLIWEAWLDIKSYVRHLIADTHAHFGTEPGPYFLPNHS